MIAKHPSGPGAQRLTDAIDKLRVRGRGRADAAAGRRASLPDCYADCSRPDAPADLPITHGLLLATIEARLTKLEQQVSNQNRILLVGIIAIAGDIVRQMLKP